MIINNSDVYITILEFNNEPLLCFTDHKNCCSSETAQVTGTWFFPNGSKIGIQTTDSNIYIERDLGVVGLLYWNSTTIPSGVYRCEIPDASGIKQKVYVRIHIMMQDFSTSRPDSEVAGAVVGVILALVLVFVVAALIVIFQVKR